MNVDLTENILVNIQDAVNAENIFTVDITQNILNICNGQNAADVKKSMNVYQMEFLHIIGLHVPNVIHILIAITEFIQDNIQNVASAISVVQTEQNLKDQTADAAMKYLLQIVVKILALQVLSEDIGLIASAAAPTYVVMDTLLQDTLIVNAVKMYTHHVLTEQFLLENHRDAHAIYVKIHVSSDT